MRHNLFAPRPSLRLWHLIVFIGLLAVPVAISGCRSDMTFGRTVKGKIAKDPGHRFKGGTNGARGGEKFSLTLKPVVADSTVRETAGGPSGVVIECTSTRCSQVAFGECHEFECKHLVREGILWGGEPNVVECKHLKEIDCKELPAEDGK